MLYYANFSSIIVNSRYKNRIVCIVLYFYTQYTYYIGILIALVLIVHQYNIIYKITFKNNLVYEILIVFQNYYPCNL